MGLRQRPLESLAARDAFSRQPLRNLPRGNRPARERGRNARMRRIGHVARREGAAAGRFHVWEEDEE